MTGRTDLLKIYGILRKAFGPRHWWPARTAQEVMIGAILTQNTSWANAAKAITALRNESGLNFKAIDQASEKVLAGRVRSARFFNQKAKALKIFAAYFGDHYGFSIRRMKNRETALLREELLTLYRIGPETADSILLYALDKPVFVIDAYTRRIFSRHGFLTGNETYDSCQAFFMNNLPRDPDLYNDYHAQIVFLGNRFCRPKPVCDSCPLKGIVKK